MLEYGGDSLRAAPQLLLPALGRAAIAESRARERPKKTTIVFSRRACTAFVIAIVLIASALTGILLAEHVIHKSSHSSAAKVATGPTASPVVSTPGIGPEPPHVVSRDQRSTYS